MEASAVHAPAALGRLSLGVPLLRLRSDDQLIELFRSGSEEAFTVIHDRYRQRLFAYVRQMLSGSSRQDAEDVMQDVFMRAYSALRKDTRDVNVKAWLYRVAHNRCIDHVRRPTPPTADVFEASRSPLVDPMETAQRRDDLRRLVQDLGRLPEQQRSALLMREIDGLSYVDIADVLAVTVAAVKSLLVRARMGLAESAEARDTDCAVIRADLAGSYERGVKASARARRHMRECSACLDYKSSLRAVRRQFAALSPLVATGPLALAAKALGFGGAASGVGATTGGGGGAMVVGGTAAAGKVAAVVCTAAIATGGAVEVKKRVAERGDGRAPATASAETAQSRGLAPAAPAATALAPPVQVRPAVIRSRTERAGAPGATAPAPERKLRGKDGKPTREPVQKAPAEPVVDPITATGGAAAPAYTLPADPLAVTGTTQGEGGAAGGTTAGSGASKPASSPQASETNAGSPSDDGTQSSQDTGSTPAG